jgi:hypothetical protein
MVAPPSLERSRAPAPSPRSCSHIVSGSAGRQSAAATRTLRAEPLSMASRAARIAVVAERSESVKSAVKTSLRRSRAAAMIEAHCFSV